MNNKSRGDDYLIDKIDKAISELVIDKHRLQKAYNYYNCKRDPEQFRYLEENYGIGSAYIQTQYFCSFDIRGERFVTINRLEELGVIKQDLRLHMDNLYNSIPQHMRHKYYKIGAIDSARHSDIAAFTAGLLYVDFDIASGINGNIDIKHP